MRGIEYLEIKYIDMGLTQHEAHDKTNESFNYSAEIDRIKEENRKNGVYKKSKKR